MQQRLPRKCQFFCSLLAFLLLVTSPVGADLGSAPYTAPLVGEFAIHRNDLNLSNSAHGAYQLVEVTGPGSSVFVITSVEKLAVSNSVIVGKTSKGYFILDTAAANPLPQEFQSLESWQAALSATGVPKNIALVTPDVIAAGLPNRSIHPWAYRIMRGTFGLSDDAWAGIVILAGLVLAFVAGLLQKRGSLLLISVGIGLGINVIGEIILAEGGPAACVGFVGLPLMCWTAASVGRAMGSGLRARSAQNPR